MLARQLRELREKSGVSTERARRLIGVGKQTLWRMETGQPVRLNPLFIERLCEAYGAPEDLTQILLRLIAETHRRGWWRAFSDVVPKHFELFIGLEEAAQQVVSYQTTLLPELLQTEEYRQALTWLKTPTLCAAEIERHVEVLNRRKARLHDAADPLSVHALIDEAALRRTIGTRSVMAEQLTYLATVGELPNVSVQVIPLSIEAYSGLDVGPFVLLEFPSHPTACLTEPPVVYLKFYTGALYLEETDAVQQYQRAYTRLQRSALSEAQSRSLIREIAKESE
ncbi:helix-turn-helix domain-containing protein [Nocardia brasiliensis]|uniref:helix-turn-helix domain-containing protein n=1 Tax=Nocardia brasiliensis TaxID=37326 RepID=UPI0024556807|nr:helix-turn-helix transcriptional regulator [Nocardia brasiliensis]